MKITTLGTNGWYSTPAGDAICTLIETKKYYVILDAGEGFYKLNNYVTKKLPVYLFLSHLHFDHIYGLHILPRMKFNSRLTVVVPRSKLRHLMGSVNSPFATPLVKKVHRVLPAETGKVEGLPFPCECQKLEHQDGSFGFRLTLEKKSIAYCLDTGYCDNSIALAKDCDLLIHECTNKPGARDGGWGHASPEEAAKVALAANAEKLLLTHFMPDYYPDKKSRRLAQAAARRIFKNSFAAMDGMEMKL